MVYILLLCGIHSLKEGECEWYMFVWYSFVEERRMRMVYIYIVLFPFCRKRNKKDVCTRKVGVVYSSYRVISLCTGFITPVICIIRF